MKVKTHNVSPHYPSISSIKKTYTCSVLKKSTLTVILAARKKVYS